MRPDEHKQKKNEQYKKKHGIKTGKTAGEGSKPTDKRRSQPTRKDDKSNESRRRDTSGALGVGAGQSQAQAKTNSESSDSDTGSTQNRGLVYERKSFSRRQIVSNWSRYELPEAGEASSEPRGEDFTRLLSSAGDALAQFRFKDEQDWEESSAPVTETSQIISLDCQSLSNAVECVPLYRRLCVDKDNFTENQIILQDLEAQKKLELYDSNQGQPLASVVNESSHIESPRPVSKSHTQIHQGEISLTTLAKPSTVSLDFGKPRDIRDGKQAGSEVKSSVSERTSVDNVADSSPVDKDLDFLLSLDAPGQTDRSKPMLSREDAQDHVNSKPDTGSVENTASNNVIKNEVNPVREGKAGSGGKEEDLEDWLDSVLGD